MIIHPLAIESKHEPLLPKHKFRSRLLNNALAALCLVATADLIGVLGYRYIAELPWVDAFLNASMILSGMGPVNELHSDAAKIFAGIYALFSGVAFITSIGLVFVPLVHRLLHRFHIVQEK